LTIHIDSIYKHVVTIDKNAMSPHEKHAHACKVWIEHRGKPLLGKGGAEILEEIESKGSISEAALRLGMSYRYVWSYLKKVENALGDPVIETFRGGKAGGGGARLTEFGKKLLDEYKHVESYLNEVLSDEEYWEVLGLKISARNRFKGKVVAVEKDGITAKVKVEVKEPTVITALISREAVEDLDIKVGDSVEAVVKATEVMIAK
jgi:molybdate transport system regulatory protein